MDATTVHLRPLRTEDFAMLERQAVDPEAGGEYNWSGFKDVAKVRRQFAQESLIGPDDGLLVVDYDGEAAGKVVWGKNTYGMPQWWCWSIGIGLLPEYRGKGIGTVAQRLLVAYLFHTTPAERVEAYTDVENEIEQKSLEKIGFVQEGTIRSVQFREGQWRDIYVYGLLRAAFMRSGCAHDIPGDSRSRGPTEIVDRR